MTVNFLERESTPPHLQKFQNSRKIESIEPRRIRIKLVRNSNISSSFHDFLERESTPPHLKIPKFAKNRLSKV